MIVGHPSFCVAVSFIFVVGLQFLLWSVYICMADVFHAKEKEQRSVVVCLIVLLHFPFRCGS